ncbi:MULTISPECIES: cupin domain-containing protein [Bradyrhizobium]|uniref:cupin domain-containing protein n=1 Tax=Bradyrhizobium TaxID=374 RepID=UPI00155E660B|nr:MULTISPECIES: cupin domain-containing protein [Bradyrhizobium]MDD1523497.1 hypothetical protein [Bradyrhizobium sp. WBAH30]MDD1547582.1 hypothetical protein [Bradyrhizobium sp. WBAH41]MDD1561216.1 hypothetical protein [Bradyrhizobium sp. WBAH23]MDD1568698.1 hypothetical protein [Bradyrhizobium sp. WBAH33]MDD1594537.1 hypothetical protein [Bradyrhizobium sp. WBAH42]
MSDHTPPFTLVNSHQRRTFWIGGQRQSIIAGEAETNGRYTLSHSLIEKGAGASEHAHGAEAEAFYILRGELEFTIAGQKKQLRRGDFLHVEPGLAYSFDPVGAESAEVLVIYAPAGLERFIAEVGIADSNDVLASREAALRSVQDVTSMKEAATSYGLRYPPRAGS